MPLRARPANADDYDLLVRFHRYFELPDPDPARDWWERFHVHARFVEDESGRAVGYGLAYRLDQLAYVLHVSVEPDARRRGVGRAVMECLAKKLRDDGTTRWALNVKEENAPAIALYRSLGLEVAFVIEVLRIDVTKVAALPASSVSVETSEPNEDRTVEDTFRFDHGRLERFREMPDRVLLRAREADRIVGVAGLDPRFPGAPIFRARDAGVARRLLEHMQTRVKPEVEHLRLVLEDDDRLARVLVSAGGEREMKLLRMVGPIP